MSNLVKDLKEQKIQLERKLKAINELLSLYDNTESVCLKEHNVYLLDELSQKINKKYNVDIKKSGRNANLINPRNEFFFEAKKLGFSYTAIAKYFGMNHATVIYGCNKHEATLTI